jgi:hypothetical protein
MAQIRDRESEHYPLALALALTGLRYGEATALRWSASETPRNARECRRCGGELLRRWLEETAVVPCAPRVHEQQGHVRDHPRLRRRIRRGGAAAFPASTVLREEERVPAWFEWQRLVDDEVAQNRYPEVGAAARESAALLAIRWLLATV